MTDKSRDKNRDRGRDRDRDRERDRTREGDRASARDRERTIVSTPFNVPKARAEVFGMPAAPGIVVPSASPRIPYAPDENTVSFKGRGPKGYQRSDELVRHAVEEALAADETLDASDIEVTCTNGEVVLSGAVKGPRARFAAVANAEAVAGPDRVRNALKIPGE